MLTAQDQINLTKEDYIKLSTILIKEAKELGVSMSANERKALPLIFRKVYEWGSYDAWDLSRGGDRYFSNAVRILENLGYLGKMWKEFYITEKAEELVNRENIFRDLDNVEEAQAASGR